MRHWTIAVMAMVLLPGQAAEGTALLTYDPGTGDVILDETGASSGFINDFTLTTTTGNSFDLDDPEAVPHAYQAMTENVDYIIQSDMISQTNSWAPTYNGFMEIFNHELTMTGIVPTGKDLTGLQAFLDTATYNGSENFELNVVPEPVTGMSLLVGGVVLAGVRRRRRRAA